MLTIALHDSKREVARGDYPPMLKLLLPALAKEVVGSRMTGVIDQRVVLGLERPPKFQDA